MITSPPQISSKSHFKAPHHLFPYHLFSIFQASPSSNSPHRENTIPSISYQLQKRYHSLRNIQKYTSKLHVNSSEDLSRKTYLGLQGLKKIDCDISAPDKSTKNLLLFLTRTLQNNPSLTKISFKVSHSEFLKPTPFKKLTLSLRKIPKLKHLSVFLEETKDSIVESFARNLKRGLKTLETFEIRTSWQVYSSPFNLVPDQYPPLSDISILFSGFSNIKSLVIAFDLCPRITSQSIKDFIIGLKSLKNLKELEVSFDYCWLGAEQKPTVDDFMCLCKSIGDLFGLEKLGMKFSTWKIDDVQFDFFSEIIEKLKFLCEIDLRFGPNGISYGCLKRQMVVFSRMARLNSLKLDFPVDKNEKMESLLKCLRPEQRKNAEVFWPEEKKIEKKEKERNFSCSLF